MFFTRTGKVIAHIVFWLGALRLGLGAFGAFATANMENNRAFAGRYLAAETTGEAINEAMIYILVAVALGILSEISASRRLSDKSGEDRN